MAEWAAALWWLLAGDFGIYPLQSELVFVWHESGGHGEPSGVADGTTADRTDRERTRAEEADRSVGK